MLFLGSSDYPSHFLNAAALSPHIHYLLYSIYSGDFDTSFPLDGLEEEWVSLYRDRWAIPFSLFDVMTYINGGRKYFQNPEISPLYISRKLENTCLSRERIVAQARSKLNAKKIDPFKTVNFIGFTPCNPKIHERAVAYRRLFRSALAFRFGLRIILPSYILYGRNPTKLFFKARHGDNDALDSLLRLDKSVTLDSRIGGYVSRAMAMPSANGSKKILKAHRGTIKRISLAKTKILMASYISEYSHQQGTRLKNPIIQDVFDAVERLNGNGLIDTDLPEMPETFRRYVNRAKPIWRKWKEDKIF